MFAGVLVEEHGFSDLDDLVLLDEEAIKQVTTKAKVGERLRLIRLLQTERKVAGTPAIEAGRRIALLTAQLTAQLTAAEKRTGLPPPLPPSSASNPALLQQNSNGAPVVLVTGVGPGTGAGIVRRFAAGGYKVAMLARQKNRLEALEAELPSTKAYVCDVRDRAAVEAVVARVRTDLGAPSVFIHNAVRAVFGNVLEWTLDDLNKNFEVNMMAFAQFIQLLGPDMIDAGNGAIICTGNTSAHRGKANFGGFASTKAGQRILAESAARFFGPKGVHVAYISIDGAIAHSFNTTPEQMGQFSEDHWIYPVSIGNEVWHLAHQPKDCWTFDHWVRNFGGDGTYPWYS